MLHNTPFIQDFMAHYDYPAEAVEAFTAALQKLDEKPGFAKTYDKLYEDFEYHRTRLDHKVVNKLTALALRMGVKNYTLHFCFLLSLTEELKWQYELLGIGEKLYYDTMADLKYKLMECIECKKVPGTFVCDWFDGFFRLDRICYGRFQFEVCNFNEDKPFTMKCGHVINKGDVMVGFHIPSSGVPLTDEVRLESYKEAYKHLHGLFPDGNVIFCCGSWLLYPKHREFLPAHMNVLKFMDDFELVNWHEYDSFHDDWRIFGAYADLPSKKWPTDTSFRKAYADWINSGNKAGSGYGVFMFDGEKIVR